MRVICINNHGWYAHEGNYFGFLESGRPSEIEGPQYGHAYQVISAFVDRLGDMCYIIGGHGDSGWESDCFILTGDTAIPHQQQKTLYAHNHSASYYPG